MVLALFLVFSACRSSFRSLAGDSAAGTGTVSASVRDSLFQYGRS
ncbi:MAG: hypothetical protein R3B96_06370 [Pirellulaceae bacterium]